MAEPTQIFDIVDHFTRRLLGQLRPANTTAASVYSPGSNIEAIIDTIVVVNTTSGSVDFRLFHDDDGSTFDESTALFWDEALAADTARIIEGPFYMNNPNGNIGVRTATNSAFTFSVYGRERT